ncbi:hypothetical protein CFB3_19180 [Clostridium folliculivorans]|uniref:Uncharacterized protein n=1 Tax=Clostridium folliculivorans TaxID=2886038 RepID=A0A9W5XZB1_9CLOT|nr:hypothetical protein CFOLD11_05210 [Clostridium folliculivorans]GKU29811.1 hypothetical protein CFB3_19180 [Clostridium folliculivorans]
MSPERFSSYALGEADVLKKLAEEGSFSDFLELQFFSHIIKIKLNGYYIWQSDKKSYSLVI